MKHLPKIFIGLFCGFWVLFGAIFLVIGGLFWHNAQTLRQNCTQATTGTVVENIRRHDSDGSTFYPVFEYQAQGRTATLYSKSGSYPPQFHEGEQVTVRYNPDRIEEAYVEEQRMTRLVGPIFMGVGGFSLLIPLIVLLALRFVRRKQNQLGMNVEQDIYYES